ncbi:Hypothetical predicted protein [Pelobates cultripes]|uniref:Uncharacterized protein n=1 Tax=Pelobates cultripes TaxID=61616 RepID=A0AAD1RGB2_PELCU|nr:Hypothetical predicted protein [Pelobates cultripes]
MSPLTATTLREWDRFNKEQRFDGGLSPAFLLDSFYGLIPSLNIMSWSNRGLIYLHQLFDQGEIIPFNRLQNKYQLPNAAAFAHRQISSWLQTNRKVLPAANRWNTFNALESLCTQTKRPLKLISILYNRHYSVPDPHTLQFVKAWEVELGKQLTKEQWSYILCENKKLTLSTTHLELARKLLYRCKVTGIDDSDGYTTPDFCRGFKCPRYRVVEKHENFEVREYEPTIWAATIVDFSADITNQSYRLFKYIHGANKKGTKTEITLPFSIFVPTNKNTKHPPLASIFLPPEFEPPEPLDSSIYVFSYPALTWYVRSFKGQSNIEDFFKHARVLANELMHLKKPFDQIFGACNFYGGTDEQNNHHIEVAYLLGHVKKSD